jgi:hypothetical protein
VILRIRGGCQWNCPSKEYSDASSVSRTFQRWVGLGTFDRLLGDGPGGVRGSRRLRLGVAGGRHVDGQGQDGGRDGPTRPRQARRWTLRLLVVLHNGYRRRAEPLALLVGIGLFSVALGVMTSTDDTTVEAVWLTLPMQLRLTPTATNLQQSWAGPPRGTVRGWLMFRISRDAPLMQFLWQQSFDRTVVIGL